MRILSIATAAALLSITSFAHAADQAGSKFIRDAIEGNLSEIQMGQLAQQKGQADEVKSFGQKLVTDHTASNTKANEVAKELGVTAPTSPTTKQKATYDRLSKLSGAGFDRAFARDMVADHKADIAKFQKAEKMSGPAGTFAKDTLPTLQEHLKIAQGLPTAKSTTGSRTH
jgi:putative membrane protein